MRRGREALLCLALIGISACVHTPAQRPQSAPVAVVPAPAAAQAAPVAEPTPAVPAPAATPAEGVSPAAADVADVTVPAPAAPAASPPPVAITQSPTPPEAPAAPAAADAAGTAPAPASTADSTVAAPASYTDLFDRMRAGFKLEDGEDRRAVDQQLRWYANNPDYLQRAFGRADLYLYHIVTELEARGMPLELALLPVVESAFEPYAYSRARATGLWQFIPGTGSRYGLRQDWWYDGRRDMVESTRAALDYLQSLHDEFNGDWLLAIAAYNCGELIVERSVAMNRAAGRPVDFWDLWLPRETRAYVPKLLAMRRLVLDPGAYGLAFSRIANQPYFTRVATGGQISFKVAAEISGVNPDDLYELNPAFHRWATDPAGPYYLLLPVDAAELFTQNIAQLSPDQLLGVNRYTVHHGDSVASLAKRFHTTVNVIRDLNDLPEGPLTVGNEVRVPAAVTDLPAKVLLAAARADGHDRRARRPHVLVVRGGETLWSIARRNGMNVNTLARLNGMQPDDALRAGQRLRVSGARSSSHARSHRHVIYTVRSGDTVAQIAQLFQCSVPQLLAWNGLTAAAHLHAGQKLRIHIVRHT
ncbi:MAG TPA: LysM peptidoglycan-binding domain-containing protein [Steroidobacteraceae bacterium]|nr:LysM peptidoglycan-binding domain-containing protein [Steroidobacteraceae bacterium]